MMQRLNRIHEYILRYEDDLIVEIENKRVNLGETITSRWIWIYWQKMGILGLQIFFFFLSSSLNGLILKYNLNQGNFFI